MNQRTRISSGLGVTAALLALGSIAIAGDPPQFPYNGWGEKDWCADADLYNCTFAQHVSQSICWDDPTYGCGIWPNDDYTLQRWIEDWHCDDTGVTLRCVKCTQWVWPNDCCVFNRPPPICPQVYPN
jgi:hypothetical protein